MFLFEDTNGGRGAGSGHGSSFPAFSDQSSHDSFSLPRNAKSGAAFSGEIRSQSILPDLHLEDYSSRTIKQLSEFFDGTISNKDKIELAGALVFPHSEAAAKLFSERIRRGELPSRRENLLSAYALFPRNPVAAEAYFSHKQSRSEPPIEDAVELYVARNFNDDLEQAEELKERLLKRAELFQEDDLSATERTEALVAFVRDELASGRRAPMPNRDLATYFGLPEKGIGALLSNEEDGLRSAEDQLRTEKLFIEEHFHNKALQIRLVQAIRNLIAIENDQHKAGLIPELSKRKEIASLFGIRTQSVRHHVRYAFRDDLEYRERTLKKSDARERAAELVDNVHESLTRSSKPFMPDSLLSKTFSLSPVAVFHVLRNEFSPEERDTRTRALGNSGRPDGSIDSPREFVRAELEAFSSGEIDRISTDEELARIFGMASSLSIYDELSPVSAGLAKNEFCKREYILALQRKENQIDDALQLSQMGAIREKIAYYRSRNPVLKQQRKRLTRPGGPKPANPGRGHVRFRGNKYDSEEEAVAAVLLQKYLPGYELQEGNTLQVEVNGRYFDFRHGNTFIEYHPIRMYYKSDGTGSFDTFDEYIGYKRQRDELREKDERQAKTYEATKRRELYRAYRDSRQGILNEAGLAGRYGLIVASSREELWHKVIDEHGEGHTSLEAFKLEWNKILKAVQERES